MLVPLRIQRVNSEKIWKHLTFLWQVHVCDNVNNTEGFMTTIVSPLVEKRKKIFSMDCEMVTLFPLSYLMVAFRFLSTQTLIVIRFSIMYLIFMNNGIMETDWQIDLQMKGVIFRLKLKKKNGIGMCERGKMCWCKGWYVEEVWLLVLAGSLLWSSTGYHTVIISLSTQCINGHWQTVRETK